MISRHFLGTTYRILLDNSSEALPVRRIELFCLSNAYIQLTVLHDLRLIHTDLKPENILLVHNDYKVVHIAVPGKVCYVVALPDKISILSKAKRPHKSKEDLALY